MALVILMIRTWAVWGMDGRLTIGLPIFFVSIWIPLSTYAVRSLKSLTSERPSRTSFYSKLIEWFKVLAVSVPPFQGCFVSRTPYASQGWALMMGFEGGTVSSAPPFYGRKAVSNAPPPPRQGMMILMAIKAYRTCESARLVTHVRYVLTL